MVVFSLTIVVLLAAKLTQATPSGNRDDIQDQEVSEIKKMVIVQSELIQSQAERLNEYGKRIDSLEKENNDLAQRTERLQTANDELESRLRHIERVNSDTRSEEDVHVISGQSTDEVDDQERGQLHSPVNQAEAVQQADGKPSRIRRVANVPQNNLTAVGFYCKLVSPNPLQLGQHQAIEFDNVITNVGNGYDSRHGHFVAPVDGLYSFTSTVLLATSTNHHLQLAIVKNGVDVGYLFSLTEFDEGTRTVVLSLAAGDMVWVRNNENSQPSIQGVGYSTFSGYLITAFSQRS